MKNSSDPSEFVDKMDKIKRDDSRYSFRPKYRDVRLPFRSSSRYSQSGWEVLRRSG